jgi:Fic family protein
VHFVPPRPEDVDDLMHGWMELTDRVVTGNVDPVVAAAVSSFAFVFIHPFMDGNGRIHRFLIHHVLAKRAFGPEGVVLPVSAAIVRDMRGYDEALETFSRPLARLIDWRWTPEREIVVDQETAHLYRYFDATALAEYLYDRVADSIERDLRQELGFIATFDRALAATREIVDMPDRRASLFIRLCLQNGGTLAKGKRSTFAELRDDEIAALERAVRTATAGDR